MTDRPIRLRGDITNDYFGFEYNRKSNKTLKDYLDQFNSKKIAIENDFIYVYVYKELTFIKHKIKDFYSVVELYRIERINEIIL